MDRHTRSKMNTQIYEEACTGFVESRAGDLDDPGRREFDRWLRKSPEHLSAYLEIAAIWHEGSSLGPESQWTADTLIELALKSTTTTSLPCSTARPAVRKPSVGAESHVGLSACAGRCACRAHALDRFQGARWRMVQALGEAGNCCLRVSNLRRDADDAGALGTRLRPPPWVSSARSSSKTAQPWN